VVLGSSFWLGIGGLTGSSEDVAAAATRGFQDSENTREFQIRKRYFRNTISQGYRCMNKILKTMVLITVTSLQEIQNSVFK
jgi:hypothetical protein